ncbi:hypothetical protein [Streptomyces sp. URMC 129]|uniref:hypothetical protein n=1 Tax=Streptomyces sp. URMC 129 TaxID=3423407 RepID=UPI003F1AE2EA
MREELRKFIRIYLDQEQAYDTSGTLRSTLHAFDRSYVQAVEQGFAHLLEHRELDTDTYEDLTSVEFEDEDSLYAYMSDLYAHLFGDRADQPMPPE